MRGKSPAGRRILCIGQGLARAHDTADCDGARRRRSTALDSADWRVGFLNGDDDHEDNHYDDDIDFVEDGSACDDRRSGATATKVKSSSARRLHIPISL